MAQRDEKAAAAAATARVVEIDGSDHRQHGRSKRKLSRSEAEFGTGESFQVRTSQFGLASVRCGLMGSLRGFHRARKVCGGKTLKNESRCK